MAISGVDYYRKAELPGQLFLDAVRRLVPARYPSAQAPEQ